MDVEAACLIALLPIWATAFEPLTAACLTAPLAEFIKLLGVGESDDLAGAALDCR